MENILVTGGAGFIGVSFVKMILRDFPDIKVVNLDALTYAGNLSSLSDVLDNKNHKFIHGDIRDGELLGRVIEENKVDGIINFAAESHVDRSITGPEIFVDTNVKGTLNLLQSANKYKIKRYLQVSTDEVYGSLPPEGMFREDTPLAPNSPYSASKTSADNFVRAYNHTFDLDTVITRCSNNYGPYQFPEKMIPLCIHNILNNKAIPVYGDGLQVRDWLFVEDHCTAIWKVCKDGEKGGVYNVGGCNEMTNLELVKILLRLLDKPESLIKFVEDRPGHDRRYAIDASKMINEMDWKPSVTFEQGIEKTIKWYLDNRGWLSDVTSGKYKKYYNEMYSNR